MQDAEDQLLKINLEPQEYLTPGYQHQIDFHNHLLKYHKFNKYNNESHALSAGMGKL